MRGSHYGPLITKQTLYIMPGTLGKISTHAGPHGSLRAQPAYLQDACLVPHLAAAGGAAPLVGRRAHELVRAVAAEPVPA